MPPTTTSPAQHITLHDNVTLPRVYLAWRSVPWCTDDDLALDVATDILGAGKNSRLHRAMVIDAQVAQSVTAYQHGLESDGKLVIVATARRGVRTAQLVDAIRRQVDLFLERGIDSREFQKSLNIKETGLIFGFDGMRDRAHALASFQTLTGSAGNVFTHHARYSTLTPEGVLARTAACLSREPVILEVLPVEGT
jgi:zinc protease